MTKHKVSYMSLRKASKVQWKNHLQKTEQMNFLHKLHSIGKTKDKQNFMKVFLWKSFFPMVTWNVFNELYRMKEMKSKHLAKLDKQLLSRHSLRGGCIFTLIATIIGSVAAAASAAASTIAGGVTAIAGAIASSSVATAATAGLITGAATAVGEKIVTSL